MANEYGELEQLVNDVTSLDTARMTLRWALERLQNIEKEKADLKKNLTLAEETARRLQVKESSLQDVYLSRAKTLEEKEDFYTKLEATMSLLGEGKLDIQQLLKKEAKLDSLRHSLENEYQEKFEELDRNQRSVIERWNARLLEVESQYAGRLAESQKKYDALRAELEGDHQGRLTSLQASFKARENELSGRIALLEGSVRQSEEKVEARRRELEAEYLAKKREAEENYRKLRNMLEEGLEQKIRAADSDHSAQITSLEVSWQAERSRLLEEQRVREEQFLAAQGRIKEIENGLAAQQEAHHNELLKIISEKESAFRAQLAALETEKTAKEQSVRELSCMLEKRAAGWEAERAAMRADFDGRAAAMQAALKEREAEIEKDYAARRESAGAASASSRAELEKELAATLAAERKAAQAERERAAAQLAAFEGERRLHIEKINSLSEEIRAAGDKLERRSAELEAEYAVRRESLEKESASMMESVRRETGGILEAERLNWKTERTRLEKTLEAVSEQFREAQLEIVSMNSSIRRTAEENAAREASITGELLAAKAGFDKELGTRVKEAVLAQTAALVEALEGMKAEKGRLSSTLELKEDEIRAVKEEGVRSRADFEARLAAEAARSAEARRAELDGAYEARQAALEEDFHERRAALEEELALKNTRLSEENAALKTTVENMSAAASAANAGAAGMAEELVAAGKAFHAEKLELQKAQAKELESSVNAAVSSAVGPYAEKLRRTQEELAAAKQAGDELAGKLLAAEKSFNAERLELHGLHGKELESSVNAAVSSAVGPYAEKLRRTQEELAAAKQAGDELAGKLLAAEKSFNAERLELHGLHGKELESSVNAAVSSAVGPYAEKLRRTQEELAEAKQAGDELAGKLLSAEKTFHAEKLEMQKAYVKELDSSLESAVSSAVENYAERLRRTQEELAGSKKEISGLSERLLISEKAFHDEKLEMQKAQVKEIDNSVEAAVSAAVEMLEQRLRHTHEELSRARKETVEQLRVMQEGFSSEKTRLLEDMDRRDRYIEGADLKIQELENEMLKYRQDASSQLMRNISEQDRHFREAAEQEKARSEERVKRLESLLAAKEQLLADSDKFCRQKQLELDKVHADLNLRLNRSNEELFSQKQELSEKEKDLNEQRLKLERDYSHKSAELERMKAELSRAIMDYKGRK